MHLSPRRDILDHSSYKHLWPTTKKQARATSLVLLARLQRDVETLLSGLIRPSTVTPAGQVEAGFFFFFFFFIPSYLNLKWPLGSVP